MVATPPAKVATPSAPVASWSVWDGSPAVCVLSAAAPSESFEAPVASRSAPSAAFRTPAASASAPEATFRVPDASAAVPLTSLSVPPWAFAAPSTSCRKPAASSEATEPTPAASEARLEALSATPVALPAAPANPAWACVTERRTSSTYDAVIPWEVDWVMAAMTARATVPWVYPELSSVARRSEAFDARPVGSERNAATDREKSAGTVSTAA